MFSSSKFLCSVQARREVPATLQLDVQTHPCFSRINLVFHTCPDRQHYSTAVLPVCPQRAGPHRGLHPAQYLSFNGCQEQTAQKERNDCKGKYIGIFPHSAVCYRSGTSGARGSVYWPGWICHARHSSSPFLNHVKS